MGFVCMCGGCGSGWGVSDGRMTVFLDESGDLGFGKRGSRWFVVGGAEEMFYS